MGVLKIWDGSAWQQAVILVGVEVEEDGVSEGTDITTLDFTTGLDVAVAGSTATISSPGASTTNLWQRVASREVSGTGNKSVANSTKVPIDSTNLPFDTVTGLAVGDRVRCSFTASGYNSAGGGHVIGLDVEVDRPTSANTYIGANNDYGVVLAGFATPAALSFVAEFTVTEAGTHGFRPTFNASAASGIICNSTTGLNDSRISWFVDKAVV